MDMPQSQKSRVDLDLNHDYISSLPADVKEKILVKLPVKDMVRTSILSGKWVDLWISIPNLVFEEKCAELELIKLVDTVLIIHQGPIQKFKLVSYHACKEAIACWLLVLSKNGIKDLELKCYGNTMMCNVPFRLISRIALERLSLAGCRINVPSYFQGFNLVRTLILSEFHLSGINIENMVSSCPLLDHLELSHFFKQRSLRILAPKLTFLKIYGVFDDIFLETPKLTSGCIHLVHADRDYQKLSVARDKKESNIIRALSRLSNIEKLDICGEFCCYLAMGPIPGNLPAVFNHLTNIYLHLCINPNEMAAALCLFESAPNLEILHIQFQVSQANYQPNFEAAWEIKAIKDSLFKHLKVMSITHEKARVPELFLLCTKSMLQFGKFVLSTASVLEKLNFIDLEDVMVVFEMLKWFPKLSKMAKIVSVPRKRSTVKQCIVSSRAPYSIV